MYSDCKMQPTKTSRWHAPKSPRFWRYLDNVIAIFRSQSIECGFMRIYEEIATVSIESPQYQNTSGESPKFPSLQSLQPDFRRLGVLCNAACSWQRCCGRCRTTPGDGLKLRADLAFPLGERLGKAKAFMFILAFYIVVYIFLSEMEKPMCR